jgi:uncharacterized membrane protein YidH (DUF202 family)
MSDAEEGVREERPAPDEPEPDATELAATRTQLADHRTALASERTLFAVLRTGFAIAAGGTVIIEVLGHQWPTWVKAPLAGALVIVGYALIMAGVERYGVVARAVEATSDGTVKVLSPRLMKALAIVLEVVLGVVIVMFLLGLFDATAST